MAFTMGVLFLALSNYGVHAKGIGRDGWSTTTTTEPSTTGWSSTTTAPPTTGWTSTTTEGWSSSTTSTTTTTPPPQGWSSTTTDEPVGWGPEHQRPASGTTNVLIGSDLVMAGNAAAAEAHGEHLQVQNGEASYGFGGDVNIWQDGGNVQSSQIDGGSASAANSLYGSQGGQADTYGAVLAAGSEVDYAQTGGAAVVGSGVMGSNGYILITNQ